MASLTTLAPVLAQAEREVAALAEAVAGLYDLPVKDAHTQWSLQRRRAELDQRLTDARRRALKIHLAMLDHEYTEVTTAVQQERLKLSAAEAELRRLQARVTAARERQGALEAQAHHLHDRRRDLVRKLEELRPSAGALPEPPLGLSA
jgi:chromosome segregation ATPase